MQWGSQKRHGFVADRPFEDLPRTVSDAIQVVCSLGQRYLWIDLYCIPQNDEQEKSRLINIMGSIYKNSSLTIIAAAGSGPEHGLPGVNPGLRRARPSLRLENCTLIPQEMSVVKEIRNSKWNSRGWTYQEALLSRRRLIFAECQTYFQCQEIHCMESFPIPVKSGPYDFTALPYQGIGSSRADLVERVKEYAQRHLSYESDALSAFRGITQEFQSRGHIIASIAGLPIVKKKQLVMELMWRVSGVAERRYAFPSWTWAGWTANWPTLRLSEPSTRPPNVVPTFVSIAVEFADGKRFEWERDRKAILARTTAGNDPKFLHMRTFAFDIEWLPEVRVLQDWPNLACRFMKLTGAYTVVCSEVFFNVRPLKVFNLTCKALLTLARGDKGLKHCYFLVVAGSPNDSYFERIGVFEAYHVPFESNEPKRCRMQDFVIK